MGVFGNIKTFESLKLREYRYLMAGQLSTSMGQWMDQVSRTWLIYSITHSPLQLGLVSAARGLPFLLLGTVAGVVADRYGRKAQVVIAQSVNALLNALLATVILTGQIQIWHIYVTGILAGTVQAFQQPARQTLINDLVGERHLLNAVSLNSAAFNVSRSVGPALGGVLIHAFGVDVSYYVQAALYVLATLWTWQIRIPRLAATAARSSHASQQSFLGSAREGLVYVVSHHTVLALLVLGLAPAVLGMPFISLMPIFAVDVLQGGARTQGLLLTAVGVGAVLGALTMASLGRGQGSGKLLIGGAIGFGVSLAFFAESPALGLSMLFALLVGVSNSAYTAQNQTMLQMMVPGELRGRVLGIALLNQGLMPVGTLFAGALAEAIGGPRAVMIMGISCALLAVGVGVLVPSLRRVSLVPRR